MAQCHLRIWNQRWSQARACPSPSSSSSSDPMPIAPTAQPEELLNGAPSPPPVDLSPVSEPEEQAKGFHSVSDSPDCPFTTQLCLLQWLPCSGGGRGERRKKEERKRKEKLRG